MEEDLLYRNLTRPELPRLRDGTISFIEDDSVAGSESWNSVYEARQDTEAGELADSNFSEEDELLLDHKSGSPFFRNLLVVVDELPERAATLEVGCGFAGISLAIARRRGLRSYGIDVSAQAVQSGRQRFQRYGFDPDTLSVGDVDQLPFPDDTFALVFGKTVFEHFDHPQQAAAEMYRTMAPGGRVILDVPNLRNSYWTKASERVLGHNHKTDYFTIEGLSSYFEIAGFKILHTWGEALFYTTPFILARELQRLISRRRDDETVSVQDVSQTKARALSGDRGRLFRAMAMADAGTKRALRALNGLASRTPLVTARNGVIIGIVAEKV